MLGPGGDPTGGLSGLRSVQSPFKSLDTAFGCFASRLFFDQALLRGNGLRLGDTGSGCGGIGSGFSGTGSGFGGIGAR
ncbi:MAG: hypothetical protein OXP36_02055, partial [Gammaproteobacteria bacterium]|nr:hypothetical protein [Gammaproteobacteria bacterium]